MGQLSQYFPTTYLITTLRNSHQEKGTSKQMSRKHEYKPRNELKNESNDSSLPDLSSTAYNIYQKMRKTGATAFSQDQLSDMASIDKKSLTDYIQELVSHQLVQAVNLQDKSLGFQSVAPEVATKKKRMSADEHLVYSHIEAAGRNGLWTRHINAKTMLHPSVVTECLKSLVRHNDLKVVRSVQHPTRKIYMLYHLQPSVELTGGPWYSDLEMDVEFVNTIMTVVWKFVVSETFPAAFEDLNDKSSSSSGKKKSLGGAAVKKQQKSYPVGQVEYPTVQKIHGFITSSSILEQGTNLGEPDIRQLCELLVYDDKFERRDGGLSYRATWNSVLDFKSKIPIDAYSEIVCGHFPVSKTCDDQLDEIDPANGNYFKQWPN